MAAAVASTILDLSLYAYGFPANVLIDKGKHFRTRLFDDVCAMLKDYAVFHDWLFPPDE